MVNKNKVSKKMLAIMLAIVLVLTTFPVGFASVFAASKDKFTVKIKDYDYSAKVTLTNAVDSSVEPRTVIAEKGEAAFTDFIEEGITYNLQITDLVGYEDYSYPGLIINGDSTEVSKTDLTEIEKATATGIVNDEFDNPASGVVVSYSAYDGNITGNVTTNDSGEYSFDFYKGIDYKVTITGEDKYKVKDNITFNAKDDKVMPTHKLEIQQFSITITTGANGSASQSSAMVNYGEDAPSILVTADENYRIDTLTVDKTEIEDAKGLSTYDVSSLLKNITDDHTVSVSFFRPEYEITINYNSNGEVKDNSDNPIAVGGKIILKEGDSAGYKAIAATNYHIASVVTDGESATGTFDNSKTEHQATFNDNKAHSVTITFAINTYSVSVVNDDGNGTIAIDSEKTNTKVLEHGSDTKVSVVANDGYYLSKFEVNGVSGLTDNDSKDLFEYTVLNITKDTNIEVEFSKKESIAVSNVIDNEYFEIVFSEPFVKQDDKYIVGENGTATVNAKSGKEIRIFKEKAWFFGYYNVYDKGKSSYVYSQDKEFSQIEFKDGNKWKSVDINLSFIVDTKAPTITNIAKSPNKDYYNNSYNVTAKVEDDYAGVDKVYYNTTDDFDSASVATYDSETKIATFTTTTEEYNSQYYIWAVDKVNNISSYEDIKIQIDNTKPTIDKFEFSGYETADNTGIYGNSNITVTVTASDKNSTITNSGVDKIQLLVNGTAYGKPKSTTNGTATFELKATDFPEAKAISATVIDNAGNTSLEKKPTDFSTYESDKVTLIDVKATVKVTTQDNGKYTSDNKNWYNEDALFNVSVNSNNAGVPIKKIELTLNGNPVTVDVNNNPLTEAVISKEFSINTNQDGEPNKDGENLIEGVVTLKNGIKTSFSGALYIDTKEPDITNFEFKSKGSSALEKALNFLTFGNFFKEKIEIAVTANDTGDSAGLKEITLYGDGEPLDTQPISDGIATFVVPTKDITDEAIHLNTTISAKATDNVNNQTIDFVYPTTTNSATFGNSGLMIETVKPTAPITCPNPAQNKNPKTADSNDWYAGDTDFNVSINDTDSGIRCVEIKVNGTDILTDSDSQSINEAFNERDTITKDLVFRVNTDLVTRDADGSYTIEVKVTDNAGNVSEVCDDAGNVSEWYTKKIYKDTDAPSVTNFEFEAKGYDKDEAVDSTNTAPVQEMPYGFYFKEDTIVTVTAEDATPTSGIKSITYYTVDKDGGKSAENTVLVNSSNKISFTVPANFKGQIYAKATDNVDNVTSDFVTPNGVIVENEEQHKKTSHITYTLQDSKDANGNDIKDAKDNNLYGADTTVDVEIADTYSGIRQIDWEIIAPFDDKKQAGTVTVDNNGKVTSVAKDGYSDDCLAEWKATTEDNLVTVLKNTISVTNNSNDIEIHFTLTDRAGNVTKDVVQKLSVDKSAPLIAIQMNENDDDTYSGFFRGKREATVYVYERNFASSDFTFDVKRTDDNNNVTNVSPTSKFEKVGVQVVDGVECYVYKMNTTFIDDGDYNFAVSAQDTASHINNSAAASHKVKDNVVKYSSNKTAEYNAQNDADRSIDNAFTIDNTKPVVSVSYDNNDVRNDKYFNSNRTATITVTEHNFTSANNRITYTRTSTKDGSAISEPEVSGWSQNGNTYTTTINYNADGDYTFAMEVVDKAGNGIKDNDVTYSGKAPKDFVVDTTIDKPIISGVENGDSYKDSVLPKIDFSDINFKDHKIVLTRTRKDEIDKDVTADFIQLSTNDKGGSFAANEETFKKIQENDGIYTLSVEITDKAENTSLEQVTFTVNRFGSVYSLGAFLASDLNNKYVQSVNDDIVITEYNPDKLVKGSLDVVVTRDGSLVEYKDGDLKISPVVNEFVNIGNSGWYQYEYTISKNVFLDTNGNPADGIYKVYVGSEDTVGNKSENISYEDCEVMFRLDHTPPTIKSVSGLEKKIVNANELNVSYEIFDAIGISEIIVEYYGKDNQMTTDRIAADGEDKENLVDVLSDLTSYSGNFTINGSNSGAHDVRIYIKDLAGNVTDTNDENFDIESIDFNREVTVSTNFFVRWYANKPLFWGSIAAIVVVAGGFAFFIAIKRRKKEDERTEEIKKNARGSQD